MQPLIKRWQIAQRITPEAEQALHTYDPILRQILFNRGVDNEAAAVRLFESNLANLPSPFDMFGMAPAIERIRWSIEHQEPIAIYGDYDVDGVTATALLTQALLLSGANVRGYIPNRFEEGYGLNKEALDALKKNGVGLVITVDCGIRSLPEAEYAHQLGLDMIISDHHQPAGELPIALAVINPKQQDCTYPDKDLAGVGIAFKIACALFERLGASISTEIFLDLVALGTVADLAPLLGENRALVRAGLIQIRRCQRQGLFSLINSSGLIPAKVSASQISFGLGPRLNAAGRLDSALAALNLLLTQDVAEAGHLAQQLEIQNRERQRMTQQIQEQAETLALQAAPDAMLLFAVHPEFNRGVIGLAASRLTERYYRPAIVAHMGEEFTRGSCRSIPEFHITEALDQCADLMEHHGGHAAAAGFTVRNQNLPELQRRLQEIAQQQLANKDLRPTYFADTEIPIGDLKPDILRSLSMLEPTGYGNSQAVFVSREVKVLGSRAIGKDNKHLKLTLSDGLYTHDAIAFGQGHWHAKLPARLDLMYTYELNEFNGRSMPQLNVKDFKPAGAPD